LHRNRNCNRGCEHLRGCRNCAEDRYSATLRDVGAGLQRAAPESGWRTGRRAGHTCRRARRTCFISAGRPPCTSAAGRCLPTGPLAGNGAGGKQTLGSPAGRPGFQSSGRKRPSLSELPIDSTRHAPARGGRRCLLPPPPQERTALGRGKGGVAARARAWRAAAAANGPRGGCGASGCGRAHDARGTLGAQRWRRRGGAAKGGLT
jgi:hypothetical protein